MANEIISAIYTFRANPRIRVLGHVNREFIIYIFTLMRVVRVFRALE